MKSGSKLFYAIGFVFNILEILVLIAVLAIFAIGLNGSPELFEEIAKDTQQTVDFLKSIMLGIIIVATIAIIVHVAIMFVVIYARKCLINKTGNVSPHIIILLVGILGFNFLYILGGIFGMVAASNDNDEDD